MRQFFAVSGLVLLAMAVVFAGDGVFALQTAGILNTTSLDILGRGIPPLGLHPNVQVVTTQGLILGGALLGWFLILIPRRADRVDAPSGGDRPENPTPPSRGDETIGP